MPHFSQMAEMDGFQEMADIWGGVLPKEQPKRYLDYEQQREGDKRHKGIKLEGPTNVRASPVPPNVLQTMMTLLLRHEDSLRCLHLDSEYVVYLNPGQGSILKELMQASRDWQSSKEKTEPLRHCLAATMASLLQARFQKIMEAQEESELRKNAVKYNLIDQNGKCPYLSWSLEQKKLIVSKTPALTMEETSDMLQAIVANMEDPRVTLRFHSLKKLDGDSSKAVPFLWMISNRVNLDLWHRLQQLSHHSCLQLTQMSLRPGNLQRSALARQLQPNKGTH